MTSKTEKMRSEVYFIKYAFPCSHILFKVRKEINEERFKEMKDAAINSKTLGKEFLEKTFFRAFERIKELAGEMKKDKWDLEVLKKYFGEKHNLVLETSDYPESFKEMCKVFIGEVAEKTKDGEIIVKYRCDKRRKVKKDFLPNLEIGDKVTIHWQYAIEKV